MDDVNFKMKYTKCKWKVKKWESDFKKEHGTNPSKSDIKNAPPLIKEAYKKYYTLKTMALETSLLGSTIGDEDAMDGFSTNLVNTDILIPSIEKSNTINDSNIKPCPDIGINSESMKLPEDISNIKVNVSQKCKEIGSTDIVNPNKSTVWGAHLSRQSKGKEHVSSVPSLSSISYTAKLFPGAKFNKRNPRKSHSFSKTKKMNESTNEITSFVHSENSLPSYEPKSLLPQLETSPLTETLDCSSVNNKIKINTTLPINSNDRIKIINTTLPINSQPVSLIQKSLNNANSELLTIRKLDTGWVERTAQSNLLEINKLCNISDSGIDLKDSSILSSSNNLRVDTSTNIECSDNEEDFIYDSDSEMENKNRFNISRPLFKRSLDSSNTTLDDRPSKKIKSEIENPTVLVDKSYLHVPDSIPMLKNQGVKSSTTLVDNVTTFDKKYINRPKFSTTLVDEQVSQNTYEDSKTIINTKRKTNGVSLVEKCSSLLDHSEPEVKSKNTTAKSKMSLQQRLEQKMASGKCNENFVKVNIQKKVFVRGKKTMTFSKYKKNQWKKNQKSLHGGDSQAGVLKCFKCGDVGHFSRTCMNGKEKLLPQVEEEEDDCPFPTLEEAAEMANECADRLHIKKKDQDISTEIPDEPEQAEALSENTDLMLQPEPVDEQCLKSSVDPMFQLNEDGSLIETPLIVTDTLIKFGHTQFRPGQEQVVMRILSGLSTLVTLATGTGKSLCYQLPAYIYYMHRKSITLVVSPLVSLMEDQVAKSSNCLKIACLHSNQTPKKRELILEQLKNNELSVLLVSPEAVVQGERMGINNFLRHLPPIAFACVDEAHCVSQWSHNFRPSYLTIFQVLREKLGIKIILGLTATATLATISSIATHIGVPDGSQGIVRATPLPDNLILSVSEENNKDLALITLLKGSRFGNCDSIIVYCTRREECERLAAFLRTSLQDVNREDNLNKRGKISCNAEAYHAGFSASRRQQVQKSFMAGNLRIVIATVAFGMGINKHDIRGVIHYNMPSTFESYVQEVGRAGRDGLPAYCHLFLDSRGRDLNELRRHIYANSTERHSIRKLLQRVFVPCRCKVNCPRHEVAFSIEDTVKALDLKQENISTLLCYMELSKENWVKVMSPVYTLCRIHSYNGAKSLKKAAKQCAPLAMAIAMELKRSGSNRLDKITKLEFSLYEVATAINWDCGVVKHHLKNLEWTKVNDQPKRSGLVVELTDLGFRLYAPGNLSSDELDAALDSLYNHVELQESLALKNLQAIFQALTEVSYKSVKDCLEEVETERCEKLKLRIRDFFSKENQLEHIPLPETALENEEQIIADVRNVICSFRDCNFTGRAIARIFHGIESPNFPALAWFKCGYWRRHLNQNFNSLCKVATRELLRMR